MITLAPLCLISPTNLTLTLDLHCLQLIFNCSQIHKVCFIKLIKKSRIKIRKNLLKNDVRYKQFLPK